MAKKTKAIFTVEVEYKGPEKPLNEIFSWSAKVEKINFKNLDSKTIDVGVTPKHGDTKKIIRAFIKTACEAAGLKSAKSRSDIGAGEYNLFYVTRRQAYREQVTGDVAIAYCGGIVEFHLNKADPQKFEVKVWDRKDPMPKPNQKYYSTYNTYYQYHNDPNATHDLNMAMPDIKDQIVEILKQHCFKHDGNFAL